MMSVHIGNIIKEAVKKKGIKVTAFANEINCSRRNVYGIFKKKNIDTELLEVISGKLGENLFLHYVSENDLNSYQHNKYAEFLIEKLASNELQTTAAEPDLVYQASENISSQLLSIIDELKKEVDRLKEFKGDK